MAIATTTALLIAAATMAVSGAAVMATSMHKLPEVQPLPALPEPLADQTAITKAGEEKAKELEAKSEEEARKEEIKQRVKRTDRAKTILTSTQGVLGEAPTVRKSLLGE